MKTLPIVTVPGPPVMVTDLPIVPLLESVPCVTDKVTVSASRDRSPRSLAPRESDPGKQSAKSEDWRTPADHSQD